MPRPLRLLSSRASSPQAARVISEARGTTKSPPEALSTATIVCSSSPPFATASTTKSSSKASEGRSSAVTCQLPEPSEAGIGAEGSGKWWEAEASGSAQPLQRACRRSETVSPPIPPRSAFPPSEALAKL